MIKLNTIQAYLLFLIIIFAASCKDDKKIITDNDYGQFRNPLLEVNKGLVKKDADRIKKFCSRRNWEMQVSERGLFYQIYEHGNGDSARKERFATLEYRVELLDGTICYTSDSLGPMKFRIGKGGVESGLEEGIMMLREGDKARFILPPYMAHGLIGDEFRIPPRSIIVYDVELLNISDN
ncbi:MAG: FKBP-type peptidyl-prolyl cis-trans isomerase [Bacteroidota bacterium]